MKLGFNTAIIPEYSFEQVIDFAADNGFACVEVACWPQGKAERRYAGVTHIDMDALDDAAVAHIRDYTAKKNVFISAIAYYPNTLSGEAEQREVAIRHLKKCIVGAEKLGVGEVNTFIGRNVALSPEANKAEFMSVWPELIAFAEEHKVRIGIENCPMYYKTEWPNGTNLACNPAFWRYMFDAIKSDYFGLNYDPSHFGYQGVDYVKFIRKFADRIFHAHMKDVWWGHGTGEAGVVGVCGQAQARRGVPVDADVEPVLVLHAPPFAEAPGQLRRVAVGVEPVEERQRDACGEADAQRVYRGHAPLAVECGLSAQAEGVACVAVVDAEVCEVVARGVVAAVERGGVGPEVAVVAGVCGCQPGVEPGCPEGRVEAGRERVGVVLLAHLRGRAVVARGDDGGHGAVVLVERGVVRAV